MNQNQNISYEEKLDINFIHKFFHKFTATNPSRLQIPKLIEKIIKDWFFKFPEKSKKTRNEIRFIFSSRSIAKM